ncbi:hypothetical protein MYX65_00035 [Acidobacteria bacterium AH-259-L09]|nr:hypothetical protein [Acidobacteria bacterium AH-259-L09]
MPTVVWDCDDVLNDLTRCWLEQWWKPTHPECELLYENLTENPPHRLLGVSQTDYLASLDAFRLCEKAETMEPVPEVVTWFRQYGYQCRHMVLTARSVDTIPSAAAWTFRHYGIWVRSFHGIPSLRKGQVVPQYDVGKAEYLHWLGKGDVLVEDSLMNLQMAERYGMATVLIPRPWNGTPGQISDALDRLVDILKVL